MKLAKETFTKHVGLDKIMQTSLQGIARKANNLKKYRFSNLYGLLNTDMLSVAWEKLNKRASAGVDKITAIELWENIGQHINKVVNDLKGKRYRAKLIRRVYIPKGNGKTRPLGIPSTIDKLVQMSVSEILTAIYEQDFYSYSYGYRPAVGAKDAVKYLSKELHFGKYNYIVEADIKGFFDNISHEWLIKMLEQRINDKAFIGLINKWLKAGILEPDGKVNNPQDGTPQGGVVSPILANIYLHYSLDLWFEKIVKVNCKGKAYMCRYADDFVCAFENESDAYKFYKALGQRLKKFNLELSAEKTNIIPFSRNSLGNSKNFDFLGFEFKWSMSRKGKPFVKKRTAPSKFRKSVNAMRNWLKENRHLPNKEKFKLLNTKLIGYYNYYGVIGNAKSLQQFFYLTVRSLFKWLQRRSQRYHLCWQKLSKMYYFTQLEKPRITEKICYN